MSEPDVARMAEEAGIAFSGRPFAVERSVSSCCHDPSGRHGAVEEHDCCHVHAETLPSNSRADELGEDHYERIPGWTVQDQAKER